MEKQTLPNSTLILVFGILSIVTCWCYGVLGLILGIVALVLANKATALYKTAPENYLGYGNVKAGKIMAIIGIILCVITIAFVLWALMAIGWEAMQDPELMQQRMEELQRQ
ncbi:CCC motif membrane protein [Lacinutrix iliipiscaria]|uniref:CCC motif membrane protein n=1 Tax=Lacinutrix iliipiscaria TaxID=1230532 RepID=A0ABW5WQW6_9FLAO